MPADIAPISIYPSRQKDIIMNRAKFFAGVRAPVFGGALNQLQVAGVEAILDACSEFGVTDPRHVAYILATPMIETGGTFSPIVESLNYSTDALRAKFGNRISAADAQAYGRNNSHAANQREIGNRIYGGDFGRRQLGNTQPGDGFAFRGRGLVQITGRHLYQVLSKLIGADLINNPDAACDLGDAAKIIVVGMRDGIFTGRKLADYFNDKASNWVAARAIVNGTDRDDDIAAFAQKFHRAILDAA